MRSKILLFCALMFLVFKTVSAQQPAGDPFGESFFAPELLVQHQMAIGLSDDQRNIIKTEIRKAQTQATELQWQLQDEMEKVILLVKPDRVDEQQTLAQLEKILSLEREIKRIQLTLVIRLKNNLTPEQQARLREIRSKTKEK